MTGGTWNAGAQSVTFNAGVSTVVLTFAVVNDTLVEGTETFGIALTAGSGYTLGSPSAANANITDNDLPNVSKVNINAHLQKTADLFGGRADFHLLANYRSSYYLNIYNQAPVIQFADRPSDAA